MSDWWCKLIEVDGKQVLFKRSLAPLNGIYTVAMTVQASDWLEGSTEGEVITTLKHSDKPFTVAEFDATTKQNIPELVGSYVKPLLSYCKGRNG